MTTIKTQTAKTAALVAGFALVFTAFVPAAGAQSVAVQCNTHFGRDLTIGMTGTDVLALQKFLNLSADTQLASVGAGSPGLETSYYGPITANAVSRFQAKHRSEILTPLGLVNPTGYFGASSRAKANALCATGPSTPTPDDDDDRDDDELRGGEADLSDFEFNRGESSGAELEEEVEIGTIEFDVEDGDIRIERLELIASSTNDNLNQQPWRYFDRAYLFADGDEIADMDVDSRSDWRETGNDRYRLTFSGLDYIVDEGDRAEITVAFDIGSIDSADLAQEFDFYVTDRGIRGVDGEGIQQYIGDEDETVTFGFDEEQSGDLRIRSNSDDPDSMTLIADEDRESDEYVVFVFDIENSDDVDAVINDLVIDVDSPLDADDVIRRATLIADRDEFRGDINADTIEFDDMDLEIEGDEEVTFELEIRLVRNAADTTLEFSINGDNIDAEGVRSGDDADVDGSASSETHTVALTGIEVDGVSTDRDSNDANTIGTYEITFEVTALEDDVFIYRGAAAGDNDATPFSEVASTTGVVYTIFQGGMASTTFVGDSALLSSGADTSGDYFVVEEGETEEFTLTVSLDPQMTGSDLFHIELDAIRFGDDNTSGTDDDTLFILPNNSEFRTGVLVLQGS